MAALGCHLKAKKKPFGFQQKFKEVKIFEPKNLKLTDADEPIRNHIAKPPLNTLSNF
jgi:hypothetical protein